MLHSMVNRLPIELDPQLAAIIRHHRSILQKERKRDGHSGNSGWLEKIVVTCQATLALAALGDERDRASIDKGIKWLLNPTVTGVEYSYWRLAPLIAVKPCSQETLNEFQRVVELSKGGLKHHPNSPLDSLLVESAFALNKANDDYIKQVISRVDDGLNSDEAATLPAHKLAYQFLVCTLHREVSQERVQKITRILESKAQLSDTAASWDGSAATTSYVLIDLVLVLSNSSQAHVHLEELAERAYNYLLGLGFKVTMPDELPAGGDIRNRAYVYSLVLRALVMFNLWRYKSAPLYFLYSDVASFPRRERNYRLLAVSLSLLLAGVLIEVSAPTVIAYTIFGPIDVWIIVGRAADILAIGTVMIATLKSALTYLLRLASA